MEEPTPPDGNADARYRADVTGPTQPPLLFLDVDRAWVAAHHPGEALLHRVDARRGLADADYVVLGEWLRRAHAQHG
ncbi:hypothetical protein [Thermomonospora amylolytica]|uniref:hypothetical protein n=1 Tax=Thermomonospora amylolytica TaxID=1411117 RepID=UPI000E6C99E8|nr:hypothetical protein [Thermomonospora amylolytica]